MDSESGPIRFTQLPRVPYRGPGQGLQVTRIREFLQFTPHGGTPGVRLVDALFNASTGLDDPDMLFFANAGVKMRYWVGVRTAFHIPCDYT